jgi:ribosome-binding factor A
MSSRKARVAEAIRDTLSEMIAREVKDPRVTAAGVVSITHVELNADLSVATIYASVYGDDAVAERALAGLRGAAGFLRGPVARRLGLARPPELRFRRDTGMAFGLELAQIVRDDEERARAAGRSEPAEPEPAEPEPAPPAPDEGDREGE